MKHSIITLVVSAAVAAVLAGAAYADKVVLKSGSYLTGKAGAAQNGSLKFVSDDLGEIEIKLENIAKLEDAGEHTIQYVDGTTEKKNLAVDAGAYVADGKALEMGNVKAIDPKEETWHGSVNVAFQADRGNTYGNTATVVANLNRRWEKDRVNFNFGYGYSKTGTSKDDATKSKDDIELDGQYDHFWATKVYSYVNGRYERDDIAGLDSRIKVGVGLGYQWLDKAESELTGKWSFNQEVGLSWVNDKYEDADPDRDNNYATVRYAHHLNWTPKWFEGVEVFHNLEYMPQVDDWAIYLGHADLGFTTMLFWNIDLLAKIQWDFNSKPSADRRKSDLRYILGLGYKW